MKPDPSWERVWHIMSDERLEVAARHYEWLKIMIPTTFTGRDAEIAAECKRRGRLDIIERARELARAALAAGVIDGYIVVTGLRR